MSNSAPAELDRLCEVMHDAYEAAAAGNGWQTQQASRKPWADVPDENKATMRAAVLALLAALPTHDEWWITTDKGRKVIGPFGSCALALDARVFVERVNRPDTYNVELVAAAGDPR